MLLVTTAFGWSRLCHYFHVRNSDAGDFHSSVFLSVAVVSSAILSTSDLLDLQLRTFFFVIDNFCDN